MRAGAMVIACAALAACSAGPSDPAARRGEAVFASKHCGACHRLSGVAGAVGEVGPPLDDLGRRTILAGVLPNTPANLAQWVRSPHSFKPGDAMPDTVLNPDQARDLAAFLESR